MGPHAGLLIEWPETLPRDTRFPVAEVAARDGHGLVHPEIVEWARYRRSALGDRLGIPFAVYQPDPDV